MNEREREQLQAELVADREALLAAVSHVQQQALAWPSRNPGWSVRDVLAQVLASDSDLISLVEAAGRSRADSLGLRGREAHEQEIARWTEATLQELAGTLAAWRSLAGAPDRPARFSVRDAGGRVVDGRDTRRCCSVLARA